MRRILVVGGGIAGVETAITLARGLPDDDVVLLSHSDVLRIVPDLMYVPTGVDVHRIEVPIRELLEREHVGLVLGQAQEVDLLDHVVRADTGELSFDVVVAAPGAEPVAVGGHRLQTADDALRLSDRLDEVFVQAVEDQERASIVIRAEVDDAWAPPAYELAVLLAARRRLLGVERLVSILLATQELQPFQWFDPDAADIVVEAVHDWEVELATGLSPSMILELDGDVVIDFPRQDPRLLPGLPGRGERGFYDVDADGRVHPDAFVVGDATSHAYKSAFAVAWQARRVLVALDGSLANLGVAASGVPVDAVEHHVDLGTRTLRIRIPIAARLQDPLLGHDMTVVVDDSPPDHLAGLLLGEALERYGGRSAARAHRAMLTRPGSRLRREVRGGHASRRSR